ncbi:MAG: hypothetical protein ABL921_09480, partial [Pirellula sp.]
ICGNDDSDDLVVVCLHRLGTEVERDWDKSSGDVLQAKEWPEGCSFAREISSADNRRGLLQHRLSHRAA